jgi:hypothetical protein
VGNKGQKSIGSRGAAIFAIILIGIVFLLLVIILKNEKETAKEMRHQEQKEFNQRVSSYIAAGEEGEEVDIGGGFGAVFEFGGNVIITSYNGNEKDVVIPEKYDKLYITEIAPEVFRGKDMETVVIPRGVKTIGDYCFADCRNLREVTHSGYLSTIREGAFEGCESLSVINGNWGIHEVGKRGFAGTSSLKNLTFLSSLPLIEEDAFRGSGLETVKLSSAYQIDSGAFADCPNLTTVELRAQTQVIADDAFEDSPNVVFLANEATKAGKYAIEHGIPLTDGKEKE